MIHCWWEWSYEDTTSVCPKEDNAVLLNGRILPSSFFLLTFLKLMFTHFHYSACYIAALPTIWSSLFSYFFHCFSPVSSQIHTISLSCKCCEVIPKLQQHFTLPQAACCQLPLSSGIVLFQGMLASSNCQLSIVRLSSWLPSVVTDLTTSSFDLNKTWKTSKSFFSIKIKWSTLEQFQNLFLFQETEWCHLCS